MIELGKERKNIGPLRPDLSESVDIFPKQRVETVKAIPIAGIERLSFEGRQSCVAVGGNLLQFAEELFDFRRRACHAEIAAGYQRALQHHFGIDALDHDGLLPIRGGRQPLDGIAVQLFVDDQPGDQSGTNADTNAELRPDPKSGNQIGNTHPSLLSGSGTMGWTALVNEE